MRIQKMLLAVAVMAVPSLAFGQSNRLSALIGAKNLMVTTAKGAEYFYLVSTNDYQMMRFKDGAITIGDDAFTVADIKTIRYHALPHFIFDEDSTTYDKTLAVDHGLVALRRSFVLNKWNSLVLPMSLTTEQVLDAFGEGTEVAKPRGLREDDATAVELQTVELTPGAEVIQANYHYLIRPTREPDLAEGKANTSFKSGTRLYGPVYLIPNVSLKAKSSARTQSLTSSDESVKLRFRGTYLKLDDSVVEGQYIRNKRIEAGTYMVGEEGVMQRNEEATEVKAFCSWVEDISDEQHELKFYLDGELMTADGIADLRLAETEGTAGDDGIYDLGGRRVGTAPLSGAHLKSGIYVIHGRKVVVK